MRVNIELFQFSDMIMGPRSSEIRNLGVIGESFRILAKKPTIELPAVSLSPFSLYVLRYNGRQGQRPLWISGNQFEY
jgi:hypothetical protein